MNLLKKHPQEEAMVLKRQPLALQSSEKSTFWLISVLNVKIIKEVISSIPFVQELLLIEEKDFFTLGKVKISYEELRDPLEFKFTISPQYPLKSYKSETIKFINKSLLKYNHVMGDGSICIHTSNHPDLKQKLLIDFYSLKNWMTSII